MYTPVKQYSTNNDLINSNRYKYHEHLIKQQLYQLKYNTIKNINISLLIYHLKKIGRIFILQIHLPSSFFSKLQCQLKPKKDFKKNYYKL